MKRYKSNEIDKLSEILKNDGVISAPTDTVFGVCARINSIKAYDKLVKTKNRPITLVLRRREDFPEYINNGRDSIAIIMATSKALEELIRKVGSPIFMSSANQSGEPTCQDLDEIEKSCPSLDGMMEGEVSFGKGSTIVDCTSEKIEILRLGPISISQIEKAIKSIK